jgi:hypothetical protein
MIRPLPIDTVKVKIDSDLTKYHQHTLCRILNDNDITSVRGVNSMIAVVSPVNQYDPQGPLAAGKENEFPVMIVNRPPKWMESNISSKYNVLVLNTVHDRSFGAVGFLVPKIWVPSIDVVRGQSGLGNKVTDVNGDSLYTKTKENVV